jgi:hypothetical protein
LHLDPQAFGEYPARVELVIVGIEWTVTLPIAEILAVVFMQILVLKLLIGEYFCTKNPESPF